MSVYEKGLVTVLALQALFVALAIPLVLRKVPRNRVYGYRTCATLRDDRLWYEANAHFGRLLVALSALVTVIALAVYRWGDLAPRTAHDLSIPLMLLPILVCGVSTTRHVRKLEREQRTSATQVDGARGRLPLSR